MTRFTTLFELYEREEDQAKTELGRQIRTLSDLDHQRSNIEQARLAAGHGIGPDQREQYQRFWTGEESRLSQLTTAIEAQVKIVAQARETLVGAHRRVATFSMLRERDRIAARKRDERREQRQSDDRAVLAHWEK